MKDQHTRMLHGRLLRPCCFVYDFYLLIPSFLVYYPLIPSGFGLYPYLFIIGFLINNFYLFLIVTN